MSYQQVAAVPGRGSSSPPARVLYVLGIHHSGTTVLSNLLGQLDGFFSVGELRSIWRKLTIPHARCGCGKALQQCPVWNRILESMMGEGGDRVAYAHDMCEQQRAALPEFHTWLRVHSLLRGRGRGLPVDSPLARYAGGLARLYQGIAEATRARVIVDSSKEPTDAALLLLMPEIDARVVQIIRDPRGTVYSILRFREGGASTAESQWRQSAYAALSWSAGNLAGAAVRRATGPASSLLLRYEDVVRSPRETIETLAAFAGQPARLATSTEPSTVIMHPTHTVGGNNNRFRIGPVQLREDTAWRSGLSRLDQVAVNSLCAPLMTLYGYRLGRRTPFVPWNLSPFSGGQEVAGQKGQEFRTQYLFPYANFHAIGSRSWPAARRGRAR
jgi:Sulfotransferase family